MADEQVRARVVARGRVQMVGFRAFAQRRALELGLRGTVRNRADGALECVIEGPKDAVVRMVGMLEHGPSAARVDGIEVEYAAPQGDLPRMTVSV